ncbi:MAG: hypothetical protein Q6370_007515 [Candidatus Sigynarchaeota archaeon]
MRRSRRTGRSKAGAAFLPDGRAAAGAAARGGAGPMDVLATRVPATAIERVRMDAVGSPRRAEVSPGCSGEVL